MSDLIILLIAGVPLLVGWILALVEVGFRPDLSSGRRVTWLIALVLLPVVGLGAYVLARPLGPGPLRTALDHDTGGSAEAVVRAAEAQARGELSDDAYRAEIARTTN